MEGMNECAICDEPLMGAVVRVLSTIPVKSEESPLLPGCVPHAFMLEATRRNAEFWRAGGHNEADKGRALLCLEQAVNAWKNAAYANAKEVLLLRAERDALLSKVATMVERGGDGR
jgi:hypothetical protein